MMKSVLCVPFLLLFLFCGCTSLSSGTRNNDSSELVIDTGCFKAVMLNPETANDNTTYGCRFMRAGWIKELYGRGQDTSMVRPHTVFPKHPTFGYTHEIVPALNLKMCDDGIHAERLNVGVGIIKQHLKNRFKAEPLDIFPWITRVQTEAGRTVVESEQRARNCGRYAYSMMVRTVFVDNSPVIEFEQILENTGALAISGSAYVHPFLNAPNGFDGCWYILPHRGDTIVNGRAFVDVLPKQVSGSPGMFAYEGQALPAGETWVAAGNFFGRNNSLYLYSDQPLEKTLFWRNKKDCFAVEPFVRVSVAPGDKTSWKWYLVVIPGSESMPDQ